ncbi:unnamed protein product [Brassicogethes aeneus]|uniref:Uncharacterized protein n=1 Tax=Brassicogethes aeneus TaxID=1431903 RepID=A0A9P0B8T5_BRAAE|nr:unnamed protein product [Brassicogethes aeneus]
MSLNKEPSNTVIVGLKKKKIKPKKDLNLSNDPSFSDLKLPYRVICSRRTIKTKQMQVRQFTKELGLHEILQSQALDGVRLHREFSNPILEYPHASELITMTPAEKRQLEEILKFGFYQKVHVGKCPPLVHGIRPGWEERKSK